MNNHINTKQWMASILVSVLFCVKIFTIIMSNYGFLPVSPGLFVMTTELVLFAVYSLIYGIKVPQLTLLLWIYLLLFFLISKLLFHDNVNDLFISFFQYCTIALVVSSVDFDIEKITAIVSAVLVVIAYPTYQLMHNEIVNTWQKVISMDICYGILPVLICTIYKFVTSYRKSKWYMIIPYIIAISFSIYVIIKGTRGCIICFICLLFLIKYNQNNKNDKMQNLKKMLSICVIIFTFFNFSNFIMWINKLMIGMGYNINFLQKSARLISSGDFSNGRVSHYYIAWKGFLSSPFFGNGIGQFRTWHPKMGYPHNMILQVLFEGGILLGIPIIILTIGAFKLVLENNNNKNIKSIAIVSFSASIPPAMLSSQLWVYPVLWFLFGLIFNKEIKVRNGDYYENSY